VVSTARRVIPSAARNLAATGQRGEIPRSLRSLGMTTRARRDGARGAFTLIELLVVIVIIGLLITAIFAVGGKVMHTQKVRGTEQIMRTIAMAIDQFKDQNPLRNVYDIDTGGMPRTFGPYPPYQLPGGATIPPIDSVRDVMEPLNCFCDPGYTLAQRLQRDFGNCQGTKDDWMCSTGGGPAPSDAANDDNRALYAYLKIKCDKVLNQVPAEAIKSLADVYHDETKYRYYVNPMTTPQTGAPGQSGSTWVDGLYFVDAWGVSLDYFLYVKLEWCPRRDMQPGGEWRVTDRVPVLRSLGISLDEYKAELAGTDLRDPDKWIFSSPFPSPALDGGSQNVRQTGQLPFPGNTRANGWARAVGAGDLDVSGDPKDWFGYVP
jgi:prepilin-type N-terminal cleavage/methylation domain-containing protein